MLLILPFAAIFPADSIVLKNSSLNLTPEVYYLETAEFLPVEQIEKSGDFKKINQSNFHKGFVDKHYWFRLKLKNDSDEQNWFVSLNSQQLDQVALYELRQGEYIRQIAGDHTPFTEWSQKYPEPTFKISLDKNTAKTFYLHVKSTSTINFSLMARDKVSLTEYNTIKSMKYLLLFILLLVYIMFILLLSWKTANWHYTWVIPLTALFYFYKFLISGNSYQFWPKHPYIQDRSLVITAIVFLLLIIQYTRSYLRLKEKQPLMDKLLKGIFFLALGGFYFFIEINLLVIRFFNLLAIILNIVLFTAALRAYLKGDKRVVYFLILWLVIGTGAILRTLILLGYIPHSDWIYDTVLIQFPAGLFLVLAMAYKKYNETEIEREYYRSKYESLVRSLSPEKKTSRTSRIDISPVLKNLKEMVTREEFWFDPEFRLSRLSALLNVRPDQLSEIFNSELDTTFKKFLNTIRINKACVLLKTSPKKTITEVFHESGYSTKSTFNSAFREVTGMSPSEYK